MAKTIKMCDMTSSIAAKVFEMLNPGHVKVMEDDYHRKTIISDVEPNNLIYPEGWYYAKGCFRNKHMSSTGTYSEIRMRTSDGKEWHEIAKYCTLY